MALTGIDPFDPTPATRRELIFGAGLSSSGPNREVVLYGNRTATGTETLDTLGVAIADDADARARYGIRSELYNMYRKYVAVDPGATLYGVAVTESGGNAAACTLTFVTTANANSTLRITITGIEIFVPITTGDTAIQIAAAATAAINNADEGMLMVTAAQGAPANDHIVTITCVHPGPRGDHVIGDGPTATRGIRATFLLACGTTVAKAVTVPGTTPDDGTAAIASVSNSEIYYHVVPWHTTNGVGSGLGDTALVTATDNQLGELMNMLITQALPINGKDQVMIAAHVGTGAQAQSVANDAQMNSVYGFLFHAEGNDWTPGQLAAHHAGVVRSQQIAHPGANFAGYTPSDNTIYNVPAPFDIANRPTATEIRADLNNGVSPVAFRTNGTPYLVRFITTHSENAAANKDYRARPGHITSVVHFAWGIVKQRWDQTKQPFVADDPAEGKKPTARTTTPGRIQALIFSVIDDLVQSKPLGVYDGPILAPDKVKKMKDSVVVTKVPAGISASVDFLSVEHLYKGEFTIRETGEAY